MSPRARAPALLLAALPAAAHLPAAANAAPPRIAALPVSLEEPARLEALPLADADDTLTLPFPAPAAPVLAAEGAGIAGQRNAYSGDYLVVAAGVAAMPQYDGAATRTLGPAVGVMGRLGPVSFSPRAAGIAFNLLPNRGQRWVFSAGPVLRYQSNRHGKVDDPAVAALGRLPFTIEAGLNASLARHGLITRYDSLSLGADVRWDASGHGGGRIINVALGYYTPVHRGVLVAGSFSADFIDDAFARFQYEVTPAGSAASGLPVFRAHGGNRSIGAQGALVVDLNGNLLDGGAALLGGVSWNHLRGSAAATPITRQRDQLIYGGGLAYAF